MFTCMACGGGVCETANVPFFVTTLQEGFQISGPKKAIQGDRVDLLCEASKYNYTDTSLVWCKQTPKGCEEIKESKRRGKKASRRQRDNELPHPIQVTKIKTSDFDVGKRLRFSAVAPEDSGIYICKAVKRDSRPKRRQQGGDVQTVVQRHMELRVRRMVPPVFTDTMGMNQEPRYIKAESVEMRCFTEGLPTPTLKWFINETEIDAKDQTDFYILNNGQSLRVPSVTSRTAGEYSCVASSRAGEAMLKQRVVQVEAPTILQTNLFALEQTEQEAAVKIVQQGTTVNLTCYARGTPPPSIHWTFGGLALNTSGEYLVLEGGQSLVLQRVEREQEGRYVCTVTNLGGVEVRHRWLELGEEGALEALLSGGVAIPVLIAVCVALVLALFLVLLVRLCLSSCRTWKAPPTPPTPRLTQYELPEDGLETESCRLTLSRDGSPYAQSMMGTVQSQGGCHGCGGCQGTCHQCSACHYNYNGLYGCSGGSIMGVRSCGTPTMSPESQAMSEFPVYPNYGMGTLPAHRIQDTLRREMSRKLKERRSASPRLSAEF